MVKFHSESHLAVTRGLLWVSQVVELHRMFTSSLDLTCLSFPLPYEVAP